MSKNTNKTRTNMPYNQSSEGDIGITETSGYGGTEVKIVDDTYKCRKPREYSETAPTLRSAKCGDLKVVEVPENDLVRIAAMRGREKGQRLEMGEDGISHALTTVQKDNLLIEPQVLKTQRTEYGKATRKAYEAHQIPGERKLMREQVPREDGLCNTLTTIQRDNLVVEPTSSAHTITAQCGALTSSSNVLMTETDKVSKTIRVGGHGWHLGHTWDAVQHCSKIRKLTPWECLRLQGWRDNEICKIRKAGVSNSQAYKQAGNGITVTVLMAIFGELFGVPYAEKLDNWDFRTANI